MTRRSPGRLALAAVAAAAVLVGALALRRTDRSHALPLAYADIIREQAQAKHLDPALIAGVIYAESKFEPHESSAGAQGLMQILPETAYYLAHLSGGSRFNAQDLATPKINVAYGSYYLRYLLGHYGQDEMLALAAYNGGVGNVDHWVAAAQAQGHALSAEEIPYPETREYVQRVMSAQQEYRSEYASELGLQ